MLVGEATRRAAEAAIAFAEAGVYRLKGKEEPVPLWRALRVLSGHGGAMRAERLEAPFVGRDRELRLVKELFHVSTETSRAQLVQASGVAGVGKSRLAWSSSSTSTASPPLTFGTRAAASPMARR